MGNQRIIQSLVIVLLITMLIPSSFAAEGDTFAEAEKISVPSAHFNSLGTSQTYYFQFNATENLNTKLRFAAVTTSNEFNMKLFDSTETEVASSANGTSYPKVINHVSSTNQTMFIEVTAASGSGDYWLNITESVILSDFGTVSGDLSSGNDVWYGIDLSQGTSYDFGLYSDEGTDFNLYLFDLNLNVLEKRSTTSNYERILEFTPTESNPYYVAVEASSGDGSYELTSQQTPDGTSTSNSIGLTLDQSYMREYVLHSSHYYNVSLTKDVSYDIAVYAQENIDNYYNFFYLFDDTGTSVDSSYTTDDKNKFFRYTPSQTVEFTLRVDRNGANKTSANYTVVVFETKAGSSSTDPVSINLGTYKDFVLPGDEKYHSIELSKDQIYRFSLSGPTEADFDMYLWGSVGTTRYAYSSRDNTADEGIEYTPDSSDIFLVEVESQFDHYGNYSLRIISGNSSEFAFEMEQVPNEDNEINTRFTYDNVDRPNSVWLTTDMIRNFSYEIKLYVSSSNVDCDMNLFDADLNLLYKFNSTERNEYWYQHFDTNMTVFMELYPFTTGDDGNCEVTISGRASQVGMTPDNAFTVVEGSNTGSFPGIGFNQETWWALNVTKGNHYTFTLSPLSNVKSDERWHLEFQIEELNIDSYIPIFSHIYHDVDEPDDPYTFTAPETMTLHISAQKGSFGDYKFEMSSSMGVTGDSWVNAIPLEIETETNLDMPGVNLINGLLSSRSGSDVFGYMIKVTDINSLDVFYAGMYFETGNDFSINYEFSNGLKVDQSSKDTSSHLALYTEIQLDDINRDYYFKIRSHQELSEPVEVTVFASFDLPAIPSTETVGGSNDGGNNDGAIGDFVSYPSSSLWLLAIFPVILVVRRRFFER